MPESESAVDSLDPKHNPNARQRTALRRLGYAIGAPVLGGITRLLWSTCRVERVIGEQTVNAVIADDQAYVPCYWHRDIFVCLMSIRGWIQRGFRAGVIISPSVDGDVPATVARRWGAEVVRGSAARTGALAMRDMHAVMRRGISIITAADGPVGPAFYFKAGILLTARIGSAPLLPMGCAADRAWIFKTWDRFMLPKPFARIAVAVGDPVAVPRGSSADELEALRERMQATIDDLSAQARAALG